jgi:hypothetical protein
MVRRKDKDKNTRIGKGRMGKESGERKAAVQISRFHCSAAGDPHNERCCEEGNTERKDPLGVVHLA